MAWPSNIAPQTPSSQYDIVEVSADGLKPICVWMKGTGGYFPVYGAKSRCRIDLPLYNQSTTRDEVWASQLGRGPVSALTNSGTASAVPFNGDILAPSDTTPLPDEIATMMQESDSFAHIPPHQNIVGQTLVRWYDGAGATGNCVGECDAAKYFTSSGGIPQMIGAAPPKLTNPTS